MSGNRERELFEAAWELPELERVYFLNRECQGQPVLRERVEVLLLAQKEAESFLKTQPDGEAKRGEGIEEKEGSLIGPYKLLQRVGEGGFGVVYMAEQTKPILRRVALKIIKLGLETKQVVGRFEAERQALAMMDHPNIAKVLDAGTTKGGRPYFVMELVRGVPITQYCDQSNLSVEERLRLFVNVCRAVQHAHQKGIIHRDLKPNNVLVTLHDGIPVPKVIDFGIAKATQHKLTDKTVFTQLQQFVGTPAYMSPEQAEMSGLDIDTRSDIYSLGVMLYELLTGRTPFDGKELLRQGLDAMRQRIREEDPPKPSTALSTLTEQDRGQVAKQRASEPRKLSLVLRGDVDWIIMKALEKDRSRRYESANEFRLDLERFMSGDPVQAVAPSHLYQVRKFVTRHRFPVLGAVFGTLLLVVTSIAMWRSSVTANDALRDAENANVLAEERRAEAETQKTVAEQLSREAYRERYVSDIKATHAYVKEGDFRLARRRLETYLPERIIEGQPDLRSFEWYYLWKQTEGPSIRRFEHEMSALGDIAFSPDTELLATGGAGGVTLWDWRRQERVSTLECEGAVLSVFFSPDQRYLVANYRALEVGQSRGIRVWKRRGDVYYQTMDWQQERHPVLARVPTDNRILFSDENGLLRVWDLDEERMLDSNAISISSGQHFGLSVSPNGQLAVALTDQDELAVMTLPELEVVRRWPFLRGRHPGANPGAPWRLSFNESNDRVWEYSDMAGLLIWDWTQKEMKPERRGALQTRVSDIAYSRAADLKVVARRDHVISLYSDTDKGLRSSLAGHQGLVKRVALSSSTRFLASFDEKEVLIWDLLKETTSETIAETFGFFNFAPPISPSGRYIAVGKIIPERQEQGYPSLGVDIYDLVSRRRIPLPEVGLYLGFLERDDEFWGIQTPAHNGNVYLRRRNEITHLGCYDLAGRKVREVALDFDRSNIMIPAFSVTRGWLALAGENGVLDLIDLKTGKLIRQWRVGSEPPQKAEFSPDGFMLATTEQRVGGPGVGDYVEVPHVKIWNLKELNSEMKPIVLRQNHERQATVPVFSPDGKVVAIGGYDSNITLWDIASGEQIGLLDGHKHPIVTLAFAPDGKTLASGAQDGLTFWNVGRQRELMSLRNVGMVNGLRFSHDGQALVYLSGDRNPWLFERYTVLRAPLVEP